MILACSFVQIVYQPLMMKLQPLRLESLVPFKEDLPVYRRAAAGHSWVLGRTAQHPVAHTTQPGVPILTPHVAREGCWLILRNQNHILILALKYMLITYTLRAAMCRPTQHRRDTEIWLLFNTLINKCFHFKKSFDVLLRSYFFVLFKWNVNVVMRLICNPLLKRKL